MDTPNLLIHRSLDDIVAPIKNEIPKPEHCKAADMLRFLFSFCSTGGDAAEVAPKDEGLMLAFKMVQGLANEPNTPLGKHLHSA